MGESRLRRANFSEESGTFRLGGSLLALGFTYALYRAMSGIAGAAWDDNILWPAATQEMMKPVVGGAMGRFFMELMSVGVSRGKIKHVGQLVGMAFLAREAYFSLDGTGWSIQHLTETNPAGDEEFAPTPVLLGALAGLYTVGYHIPTMMGGNKHIK